MIALKEVVIIVIEHLQEIQIDIIIEMIIRLHLEIIMVIKDTQEIVVIHLIIKEMNHKHL